MVAPVGVAFDAGVNASCPNYGQVRVTWTDPLPLTGWNNLMLVRNPNGDPVSETDGTTLFAGPTATPMTFLDTTGIPGKRYYYGVFVFSTVANDWVPAGSDDALFTTNYGSSDVLWDRLPTLYKLDSFQNLTATPKTGTPLYKFLTVFGFAIDDFRTQLDELLSLDGAHVPENALPALLAQLGFGPESLLNARARRQLAINAVELYQGKGEVETLELLTNIITDWDAGISIGKNMMLDNLDALTDVSYGRWNTGRVGCTLQAMDTGNNGIVPAFGRGFLQVTPTTPSTTMTISHGSLGRLGRLYGIPIIQARNYAASVYARGPVGANAQLFIDWYGVHGETVAISVNGPITPLAPGQWTRLTDVDVSPQGARYAVLRVVVTTPGGPVFFNAAQFELVPTGGVPTSYKPARHILIALRGDLINEVVNPNGFNNALNWEGNTAGLARNSNGFLLAWSVADQVSPGDHRSVSASPKVRVDPGSTVTMLAEIRAGSTPEIGAALSAATAIEIDAACFLRLFSGDAEIPPYHFGQGDFVRLTDVVYPSNPTLGSAPWQQVTLTYQVPSDGSVTYVEAGIGITRLRMNQIGPLKVASVAGPHTPGFGGTGTLLVTKIPQGPLVTPITPNLATFQGTGTLFPNAVPPNAATPMPPLPGVGTMDAVVFKNVALIKNRVFPPFYFDGASTSTDSEYLWESTAQNSRSHFYNQRSTKVQRLLAILPQFIPQPLLHWDDAYNLNSVAFTYAQPDAVVMTPNWAVMDYSTQPSPTALQIVGTQVEIDWGWCGTWNDLVAQFATWNAVVAAYQSWNTLNGGS